MTGIAPVVALDHILCPTDFSAFAAFTEATLEAIDFCQSPTRVYMCDGMCWA